MNLLTLPPLSLYIHFPWCIQKCPYCDFNSHALKGELPEQTYITALLQDLDNDLALVQGRECVSIFMGGGTPSLFSGRAIKKVLDEIQARIPFADNIEITLEANPGTVEQTRFNDYRAAGINRLSIGVQSFQDEKLKNLGRIHGADEAIKAVQSAQSAGFENFNIDIMHGLPDQTIKDALYDLEQAIALKPTHLSWYQLTLEPNTLFYKQPPKLPPEDVLFELEQAGKQMIREAGYSQYEVSAYSKKAFECQHNLNYWTFGDYLGIGAGAHSKITLPSKQKITRLQKFKHPKTYLSACDTYIQENRTLSQKDTTFEFMLNALRLHQSIPIELFEKRTGLSCECTEAVFKQAKSDSYLSYDGKHFETTEKGKLFLNELLELFLC